MTWKRDTRPGNVRTIGDFRIFSEVNSDRETAHVVQFPDGREYRILPDHRSGATRSKLTREIAESCAVYSGRLESAEGLLIFFRGWADAFSLIWEEVTPDLDVTIEEWLDEWFGGGPGPREEAERLIGDLDVDGWEIRRKE